MKKKNRGLFLDDLDLRILRTLKGNARLTYTEIGRQLKLAHSTIYDRVKKMEDHGIIKEYTVIIDPKKAGMKHLTAILTIFTNPKESENVAEKLASRTSLVTALWSLW